MMKCCIVLLLSFLAATAAAQSGNYDIALIPDSLKKNAYTVKREELIAFEVKAADKAMYKVHEVISVLSEAGKEALFFQLSSNSFFSVGDVSLQLFDSKGKSIRKYSKSDMVKQAYGSGLVPDGKIYYLSIPVPEYPVTLQKDYEIKYSSLWSYPAYTIQSPNQSVIHSAYTATISPELDLRFKPRNTRLAPQVSSTDKYKTYNWSVSNLAALKPEPGSGNSEGLFPEILIAPNKIAYDGYAGDMSSWKTMGEWYNRLVKNDNQLSPEYSGEIKKMTAGVVDDKEKIKIIYEFLQKNFRYVSIQLGIGGLKPFSADFVHKNKYGDCKALSNYMQACLNAVNIKGYSAWINGDRYPNIVDPGFPDDPFNHQILCVPMATDTIWLECTSNTADFGVLGNFTENRCALLLTENGGVLVNTPKSRAEQNRLHTSSTITLQEDGSGTAVSQLYSDGAYTEIFLYYIVDQKKDEQKKFLVDYMEFLQPDAFEISYNKTDHAAPVQLQMSIEKIPEFTAGNKMFLNPRIYKIWSSALPKEDIRIQDFYFQHPFVKTDTSTYILPAGFGLETLPKGRALQFEFGSFTTSYRFDETQKRIVTTAALTLTEQRIPAAKFIAAKKFFNEVLAEFTEKIVIKKL